MLVLRWLLFFVLGDVLVAVGVSSVVVPLVATSTYFGAVWDAGFDFELAGIFYDISTEHQMSFIELVVLGTFLPGLFGAFILANASLRNASWKFWRWRL